MNLSQSHICIRTSLRIHAPRAEWNTIDSRIIFVAIALNLVELLLINGVYLCGTLIGEH